MKGVVAEHRQSTVLLLRALVNLLFYYYVHMDRYIHTLLHTVPGTAEDGTTTDCLRWVLLYSIQCIRWQCMSPVASKHLVGQNIVLFFGVSTCDGAQQ